jgi:hypothetical protein
MQYISSTSKTKTLSVVAVLSAALFGATTAGAGSEEFANPAFSISNQAVIASGTCIAKYVAVLEDASKPAAEIGQLVAKRCAKQIATAAGLASWQLGKPDEFAKNLKYVRDDLTTSTVERARAAAAQRVASL